LLAGYACGDMWPMIEVCKIWQRVDPRPGDRSPGVHSIIKHAQFRGDNRARRPLFFFRELIFRSDRAQRSGNELMTVHADTGGWNAGVAALIGAEVAVLALDLQLTRM
jgi:hypothetical protein